jgi:hypothetical protein
VTSARTKTPAGGTRFLLQGSHCPPFPALLAGRRTHSVVEPTVSDLYFSAMRLLSTHFLRGRPRGGWAGRAGQTDVAGHSALTLSGSPAPGDLRPLHFDWEGEISIRASIGRPQRAWTGSNSRQRDPCDSDQSSRACAGRPDHSLHIQGAGGPSPAVCALSRLERVI